MLARGVICADQHHGLGAFLSKFNFTEKYKKLHFSFVSLLDTADDKTKFLIGNLRHA